MPIAAPTNCWTQSEATLATAIANSAAFQAMVGAADATEASAWVFGEQLDAPLDGQSYDLDESQDLHRHIAQVYSARSGPYGKRRTETRTYWAFGVAVIYIERLVSEASRERAEIPQAIEREFKNTIGDIIDDILEWLETNGGVEVGSIVVDDGPGWNPRERWGADGAWQGVALLVEWGQQQ